MVTKTTSGHATTAATATPITGQPITPTTHREMLDQLAALLNHTHTFTDDYTTACNCIAPPPPPPPAAIPVPAANCSRGSL